MIADPCCAGLVAELGVPSWLAMARISGSDAETATRTVLERWPFDSTVTS
jgi:hypothetical protein